MVKKGKYRHYKNQKLYEVLDIANHTETQEKMVIYRALYHCEKFGPYPLWVRPLKMFLQKIEEGKPRFEYISDMP